LALVAQVLSLAASRRYRRYPVSPARRLVGNELLVGSQVSNGFLGVDVVATRRPEGIVADQ
jgi:hypothetical protein